jgi:hypothetical protein
MTDNKPNEIPKFDLADQIMAQQRKYSAIRRKAPGRKSEVQNQQQPRSFSYAAMPPQIVYQEDKIIADIVARDIEKICAGNM